MSDFLDVYVERPLLEEYLVTSKSIFYMLANLKNLILLVVHLIVVVQKMPLHTMALLGIVSLGLLSPLEWIEALFETKSRTIL
jgi:hypothetical protein